MPSLLDDRNTQRGKLMDGKRFDDLSRRLASRQSRRHFFGLIGAAAASALARQTVGAAPKDDKPTKCYGEGSQCTNGKQCCSSICTNRQCAADVPTCSTAADCAGIDDECQQRTCTNGICGVAYTPSGVPVSNQVSGDCQSNVCDGLGGVRSVPDDSDLPIVADDCTTGSCTNGIPGTVPREAYAPCESNGGFICNGAGQCVVCIPGDTQSCYTGPAGTEGVGVCQAGTQTCLADGSGFDVCAGEVHPSLERCNGLDDDCDGVIDEGIPGVGGPCSTGLAGVCAQGILQCQGGGLRCVPLVPPFSRPEICNGLDDDCDGLIDEGACPAPQRCQLDQGAYRCCIPSDLNSGGNCDLCCSGDCNFFSTVCS
jgi:hypothetical protein